VVDALDRVVAWLGELPSAVDDAERIDRIAALERLRGAIAAAQAQETVDFARSQLATQAEAGVLAARRGSGIPEQIGFARRMSPAAAARHVTFAQEWFAEMPALATLLRAGQVSEWVAQIVARETRGLPAHLRAGIAADLAPDLPAMSPRQAEAAARTAGYRADPRAVLGRARTARSDRRVGIRPAPDTMAVLSAFLPAEQGIAAWTSLTRHARAARAGGDPRSHGQVMADTLVERLTGQAAGNAVPIEIGVTMTADTLLGTDDVPADLHGYGPIPADLALDLAGQADETAAPDGVAAATWVRRLFTDPVDDTVVRVDTRRRRFDGALARLIRFRDQVCTDPYCTAPIRHLDHVTAYRDGGPTTAANGAGLCERGNYVKDMPGWTRHVRDVGGARAIEITTPTGHRYTTTPPPALGPGGNHHELARRAALRRLRAIRPQTRGGPANSGERASSQVPP
jgi:Domain of unknown function (DUF222)